MVPVRNIGGGGCGGNLAGRIGQTHQEVVELVALRRVAPRSAAQRAADRRSPPPPPRPLAATREELSQRDHCHQWFSSDDLERVDAFGLRRRDSGMRR